MVNRRKRAEGRSGRPRTKGTTKRRKKGATEKRAPNAKITEEQQATAIKRPGLTQVTKTKGKPHRAKRKSHTSSRAASANRAPPAQPTARSRRTKGLGSLDIAGPTEAYRHEYLGLRATAKPPLSDHERRRVSWTVTTRRKNKPYYGATVRHLVAADEPTDRITIKARVKRETEITLEGTLDVRVLPRIPDPGELGSLVALDSPVDDAVPMSRAVVFAASVGLGPMLFVGRRFETPSERVGVECSAPPLDATYKSADYASFGHWPAVMEPTVLEESRGAFTAVNTYDAGGFSFGIIQFAAHTYNANFHKLLQRSLKDLPDIRRQYFPELEVRTVEGREELFGRDTATGVFKRLTTPKKPGNDDFIAFLKPNTKRVTYEEITFAARLIVATRLHASLRRLQVELAVERGKAQFKRLQALPAAIDGQRDDVCAWVFDIGNQGRANNKQIADALAAADPAAELEKLGAATYGTRINRMKSLIAKRLASGLFGNKKYNATTNEFE